MKKIINIFSTYYIVFCIYALIGWLYEVFWMWFVVPPYHFINRGVLIGPFLPIYGFGMLLLLLLLKKFKENKHTLENSLVLFLSVTTLITFIYTTIIEYIITPKILSVIEFLQRYGIGLLLVNILSLGIIYLLTKIKKTSRIKELDVTIVLVFLLIWIITTIVEYLSHFIIDKCFNILLWNYTKDFLNINARVNWDASRNFAIGGTSLLYTIQPLLDKYIIKIENKKKLLITLIIGIPMLLDFIFHVILRII